MKDAESTPLTLTDGDKFEIELYKGMKNDPYFKHHLHTHFAYFAEVMNDFVSAAPLMSKGHVYILLNRNSMITSN
jgi:hypothetical protein